MRLAQALQGILSSLDVTLLRFFARLRTGKERTYIHGANTKLIYILGYFGTVYAPRFMVAEPAHITIQESYRQDGSYHWQLTGPYARITAEHI